MDAIARYVKQAMLQDKYLSQADICKTASIEIKAPIGNVYPVVEKLDFSRSTIIYWLFKLRGIPVPESLTLKGLEKINFVKLETIHNREMIIGLIGQFWKPRGKLRKFNPEEFIRYSHADFLKATWNFELRKINDSKTQLITETKVFCPTQKTKNKFRIYWTIIEPFSSWIRREILKAIKKQAESMP